MVTGDSVHIAYIIAASHDKEVRTADVLNVCEMAPNRELRDDAGKSATKVRAICGLMSAGIFYGVHLAQCI